MLGEAWIEVVAVTGVAEGAVVVVVVGTGAGAACPSIVLLLVLFVVAVKRVSSGKYEH